MSSALRAIADEHPRCHVMAAEIATWPVTVDVPTAGAAFGLGRAQSYELARRDEFPVPVLKLGHRYRVVTAHVRELLGIT